MFLSTETILELIPQLEEVDKALSAATQADPIMIGQTDILFTMGMQDPAAMATGMQSYTALMGKFKSSMMDVVSKFTQGTYSYAKAMDTWSKLTKDHYTKAFFAGTQSMGNTFYRRLGLTKKDVAFISGAVKYEKRFFRKFLLDIKNPEHVPKHSYVKRAGYYADSAKSQYFNGMLAGSGSQMDIWWVLGVPEEHCDICPLYARRRWTWKTLPTTPRAGQTPCLYRCYCHLEFRPRRGPKVFDFAGKATEGAMRGLGRYGRVLDSAGKGIGGELQREIEGYMARMNRARQMIEITKGAERAKWIAERKLWNRRIIDRSVVGGYRTVPTISVKSLTETIRRIAAKGGSLVDELATLGVGDEVMLVRSDFSSAGVLTMKGNQLIFQGPSGMKLPIQTDTDIIFLMERQWKPSGTLEQANRWAKGSSEKGSLFHGTALTSAENIVKSGFSLKQSNYGMLGKGIYLATSETVAGRYAQYKGREAGQLLEIKINVKKPLTDLKIMTKLEEKWMKKLDIDMPGHFKVWDKVTEELIELGYDAVRVDLFGGEVEWCVFNPKNVMVITK